MLALLFAAVTLDYHLQAGDKWTVERTLQFSGGPQEVDFAQVETISYAVKGSAGTLRLTGSWKLKETRVDGQVVPLPKGVEASVRTVFLKGDGETEDLKMDPDIARYRIERMMSLGRPEPEFWSAPPNVRLVGAIGEPRQADRSGTRFTLERKENAGDRPMSAQGDFQIDKATGILTQGKWRIQNTPIPGGDSTCDLEVSLKVTEMSLAKR